MKIILLSLIATFLNIAFTAPTILGGKSIPESYFPAVIEFEISKSEKVVTCTATFISNNTLITAAHCVSSLNSACEKVHHDTSRITIKDKTQNFKKLKVKEIISQPDSYSGMNFNAKESECSQSINPRYDIALLILDKNTKHPTIRISTTFPNTKNKKYKFIGYGQSLFEEIELFSRKWFHNYETQFELGGKKQIGYFKIIKQNFAMPHETIFTKYLKGKVYDSSTTHHLLFGDSGGPLLNDANEIMGIASMFNKNNITNEETGFLIGYSLKSYFSPLHREEFKNQLKLAISKGSTYSF